MAFVFPAQLLNPASVKLSLSARVVSSPPSISGVTQALRTDGGGLWQLQYSGIVLRTDDQQRIWGAWDSYLAGGVQRISVPVLSNRLGPRGLQGGRLARYGGLVSTGDPYFPSRVSYAAPLVVATANAAMLRATTLSINIAQGVAPRGGEVFSILHPTTGNRAYRIERSLGSGSYRITPPLREAITSLTSLNFDWPLLDSISVPGNDFSADVQGGRSEVSITFQEAF